MRLAPTLLIVLCMLGALAAPGGAGPYAKPARIRQAMQNSADYLRGPKLQGGRPVRTPLGDVVSASGSFATVVRFALADGKEIALRIPHPSPDSPEGADVGVFVSRYRALIGYLEQLRVAGTAPPELIEIDLIDEAAVIDGKRLPALISPWLSEARTMDQLVTKRLADQRPEAVKLLAENFRAMMFDLRAVGLAHGDLHPGNMFILKTGELKLIDLDGVFAPPLAGKVVNAEIGKENFQHPVYFFSEGATRRPFNGEMDNFSATLIYLSLRAVAADPTLWRDFHNNDDSNLIFDAQRDFLDPEGSPVVARLEASPDPAVRALTKLFLGHLDGAPEDVPSLERTLRRVERATRGRRGGDAGPPPPPTPTSAPPRVEAAPRPAPRTGRTFEAALLAATGTTAPAPPSAVRVRALLGILGHAGPANDINVLIDNLTIPFELISDVRAESGVFTITYANPGGAAKVATSSAPAVFFANSTGQDIATLRAGDRRLDPVRAASAASPTR